MPIVRVDEKGNSLKRLHRKVAVVAAAFVLAGMYKYFTGDVTDGLAIMVAAGALASIWNLADDS